MKTCQIVQTHKPL